jgi:hypothetical protein
MFPQIPFGFQTNVRLYRANSTIGISNISVVSFVGEVRNALSSMGLRDVNSYTDLQLVRYADSLVGLNGIATQTYLNSVKQAQSIIEINPVITTTLLSRLPQAASIIDLTNVSTTATGSLIPSGQLYWRSITQDEWRGITQDEWRSIEQSEALWTPANITTQLWLDASDSATITLVSGAVSQWNDKSGNNRHATQTVSASRPTVATAALNGLDGLNFDGSNDFLETVGYIACNNSSSNTVVLAVSESSGTGRRGIMGTRPAANAEGWFLSYLSGSTANPAVVFTGVSGASAIGSFRTPDILGFQKTATTCQIISFLNTPNTPTTMTLIPVSSIESTKIGREMTGQAGESLLGKIYEIIEIPTIDATIRQKAEGYLAHKWGLTANLPSDHPYKTNPPTV